MALWIGPAAFCVFFWLGCVRKIEPFYAYFYFFAWSAYLWTIARLLRRQGRDPLQNKKDVVWIGCVSTTVWLIFEVFNFRLQNWSYSGVPKGAWIRWPGYALSFATVMPGILWTADLWKTNSHPAQPKRGGPGPAPWRPFPAWPIGIVMTLLPLFWPRLFFPLVWGGVFFLAEPYVQSRGGHSLIADWRQGRWRTTGVLLLSGLICGLFWEFCNYWAGSKWEYHLPYWNAGRVFEMPILGFLGFPPFALEVFILYQAARLFWQMKSPVQRRWLIAGMVVFWLGAFEGIDRWSGRLSGTDTSRVQAAQRGHQEGVYQAGGHGGHQPPSHDRA